MTTVSHAHRCATKASQSPEESAAESEQAAAYAGALAALHQAITSWLPTVSGATLVSQGLIEVQLGGVFADLREMLSERVRTMAYEGAFAGRSTAARRHGIDVDPRDLSGWTSRALDEMASTASQQTHSRQQHDIAVSIADAYRAGMDVDEIAAELRTNVFPPMRQHEARRIAQTEVHAGAERGKLGLLRQAGVERHRWLCAFLPSSRTAHKRTSGQERAVGGQFSLSGHRPRFPGDPILPASQRVNCYCRLSLPN